MNWPHRTKLVLIGGPTCSGKTGLAKKLRSELGGDYTCNLLHMDGWYRPDLPNFDTPEALYRDDFETDALQLLSGNPIEARYLGDHTNQTPIGSATLTAKSYLVVEGIFVLCFDALVSQAALAVYAGVTPETMCLRRIRRDAIDYGEELDSVLSRIENQVIPGYRDFVLPTKSRANLLLDETESMEVHLKKLLAVLL